MQATSSNANEDNANVLRTTDEEELSPAAIRKQFYNTQWKQQRLWALRIRLSFFHMLIYYVVFGVLFIVIAFLCYMSAANTPGIIRIDYTDCVDVSSRSPTNSTPMQRCRDTEFKKGVCKCEIEFKIEDENLVNQDKVIFYYELSNFLQNIRKYKHDVDLTQLEGRAVQGNSAVPPTCRYEYFKRGASNKPIYPCGKVANSYFSDEIEMMTGGGPNIIESEGIAWESDKAIYKRPQIPKWSDITNYFELPRDWHDELKSLFLQQNGVENEHFIVWMRTAAFRTFRKKYGYIKNIQKEMYTVTINYRYDVVSFSGRKSIVIAADSRDLPVDYFFFYTFLIVGATCLLVGPLLYLVECIVKQVHKKNLRRRNETTKENEPDDEHELHGSGSNTTLKSTSSAFAARL
ncbi:Cell cycle control protein 50B [Orchesella cincta]|uniref:Cell cycle control protein 50B n=1 Tax=Orchesella cincta TaxID=48709 RepID=A0A1D2N3Z8_ORCCI|nr:Cell cycle control protein 50B [Orchesella cincta]